ncbi:hypothetical protein SNE26_20640 [Mucilaginibacter sp. cycad4]|uniref:hypothetical protein n=1 Tax=Mucilaginibacter sp. cycad4 TaxID=3342096 RepID=UPI002AAAFBCB|nr:hypothetical protein [Mucilaginibacter gossypii]WPU98437.1 hypothetical protein SNE26_20640 [Mucilaginibacter gossypii]
MGILANKTGRKALTILGQTLKFFDQTALLYMSAADAGEARKAENLIKGIIEGNGFTARNRNGNYILFKTTKI